MAENIIETRILLRYGTYSQWMNSNVILRQGEAAVCAFPNNRVIDQLSNTTPEHTPPAIGIKIGDGYHYFHELPWVQGIAADVYNWAKTSTKPTYTASEIQGLQTFIEDLVPGAGGEYTIAPRLYQLVEGTNDNVNKYYLQYKEAGSDWTLDVNHYIDLTQLATLINWIKESNITNYPNLTTLTGSQMVGFINGLAYTDTPVENTFVTAVNETSGKITVSRARPTFENISGTATVAQGGTGVTTFNSNEVLIGNGTGAIQTRPIATEIATNTHLVPNYLIKNYVDHAVEGLTGAMHFIGEASVVITPNTSIDPRITDYNFAQAQPGDVILYQAKEYVWTGGVWRLLGDEGSYAVKGSITDSDIDPNADIAMTKIAGLNAALNNKVTAESGKQLSTNDYTNEDRAKLNGIESGAERNVIEHILLNDNEIQPNANREVNLQISEFTQEAQSKLASIASGAQVNSIERINFDGIDYLPDETKVITLTSDPHLDHVNKIESIVINGTTYPPDKNKQVTITIDQAALNLNVIEGATIPNGRGGYEDVTQTSKKLELERIAVTGNVADLRQTADTYIVLDCGTSTTVI